MGDNARKETVEYEQDRLGNERKKIDTLRAQEGNEGLDTDEGIAEIGSAGTGSSQLLYSKPTHAQRVFVTQVWGFNSVGSGDNSFILEEATLDGSNSISSSKQRSVPIVVDSATTRVEEYEGMEFDGAISVNSEFQGQVGIAVVSDHEEYHEPASEQTESP